MARKTTTRSARRRTAKTTAPAGAGPRVRIRMYRLGVGDCFLLAFPREGQEDFRILVDCGVHQAQKGGSDQMKKVVADLHEVTKGRIDIVVGTHEHQDHLSGFPEVLAAFKEGAAEEIWVAWTEDEKDALANSLRQSKGKALAMLSGARLHMRANGAGEEADRLGSVLGFFGDGSGPRLKSFGDAMKKLSTTIHYRKPGEVPIELLGGQMRVFVLGPPRDPRMIGQSAPSKSGDEVYAAAGYRFGTYAEMIDEVGPAFEKEPAPPFDNRFTVPIGRTKDDPFFAKRYWAGTTDAKLTDRIDNTQDWRRIDADWMTAATALGLKLDEDTNNTSLVLAFELGPKEKDGPVLLFAADAQVGNWKSWQTVKWENYGGRTITGPDLLRRTILYKVGHHASHNATLKKLGLEMMTALEMALVPTDAAMAAKVKWGTLPWTPLLTALEAKATHGVVRTDRPLPAKAAPRVRETPLYYEVTL